MTIGYHPRFHAAFWEHALLKDDVVCAGKPDAAAIFFEGWAVAASVGLYSMATLEKQLLNMIGNLV